MSQELAQYIGETGIEQRVEQSAIDAVTKSGDWLPTIRVTTNMSALVTEGKLPVGRLYLSRDKNSFKDLGTEIEVLALAFHPRAMDTRGATPLTYYNINSPEFQRIVADSQVADSQCFFGPEFLVWFPAENTFAMILFGSKTARKEAPALLALMNEGRETNVFGPTKARIAVRLVKDEAKRRSWHSLQVLPMSTPLPPPSETFTESYKDILEDFKNSKDSAVETTSVGTTAGRER